MVKNRKRLLLFLTFGLLIFTLSSCGFKPDRKAGRCFYYWKSVYQTSSEDLASLKALRIKRLYLKFFDVVWDPGYNGPVPISVMEFASQPPARMEIVPVIFITVDALERLPLAQCGGLAEKIHHKINTILKRNRLGEVAEIQLDCDWNSATRVKYFTILARLRQLISPKIKLSATIRLHQVKYASETGIPPVDRGMLMFYNFDSPKSPEINNSILDLQVGKEYTAGLDKYPLELDLALPLFSWGVLFHEDRFQGLIGDLRIADLSANKLFKPVSPNRFLALGDCRLKNTRIIKNDLIRVEESQYAEVLAGGLYLAKRVHSPGLNVALFYFDRNLIQGVGGREKIDYLYHSLH